MGPLPALLNISKDRDMVLFSSLPHPSAGGSLGPWRAALAQRRAASGPHLLFSKPLQKEKNTFDEARKGPLSLAGGHGAGCAGAIRHVVLHSVGSSAPQDAAFAAENTSETNVDSPRSRNRSPRLKSPQLQPRVPRGRVTTLTARHLAVTQSA